jgi:hypothetical protein
MGARQPGFSKKQRRRCCHEKLLQKGPFFARNWPKRCISRLKNGGFSGFVFIDEYIWLVGEDVYYLSLVMINPSQKMGFEGGGVGGWGGGGVAVFLLLLIAFPLPLRPLLFPTQNHYAPAAGNYMQSTCPSCGGANRRLRAMGFIVSQVPKSEGPGRPAANPPAHRDKAAMDGAQRVPCSTRGRRFLFYQRPVILRKDEYPLFINRKSILLDRGR